MLALLALTVDESDEAFANVYSGAVSLQNLMPRVPQRMLVAGTAAIATIGALLVDLRNYQPFLFLLGSFFVPLFGVLLADWLLAGRRYRRGTTSSVRPSSGSSPWPRGSRASASTSGSIRMGPAGGRASSRIPIRMRCRGGALRSRASPRPSPSRLPRAPSARRPALAGA